MKHCISLSAALLLSGHGLLDYIGAAILDRKSSLDKIQLSIKMSWREIIELMEAYPDSGAPLTCLNIERSKKIIWLAQLEAPEGWEGGDRVFASLNTIIFLAIYHPDHQ